MPADWLMILGRRVPVLALVGGVALGVVATSVPFLQVRFVVEGRFGALFEVGAVRERFRHAPCAFAVGFALTVLAAVPLYLLKIERVPPEVAGLASVLFVGLLFPARVGCGWAYAQGGGPEARRHWAWRTLGRLGMVPRRWVTWRSSFWPSSPPGGASGASSSNTRS